MGVFGFSGAGRAGSASGGTVDAEERRREKDSRRPAAVVTPPPGTLRRDAAEDDADARSSSALAVSNEVPGKSTETVEFFSNEKYANENLRWCR